MQVTRQTLRANAGVTMVMRDINHMAFTHIIPSGRKNWINGSAHGREMGRRIVGTRRAEMGKLAFTQINVTAAVFAHAFREAVTTAVVR